VSTAEIAPNDSVIARAAKMASLPQALEKAVIQGDLSYLTADDRVKFYSAVCNSLGLNPLTKPFLYVQLNGKLTLYASKDATDQLRKIHGVSVTKMEKSYDADVYCVTAYGCDKTGRTDVSTGAVTLGKLTGEARANAVMKAETKAKRRLTLSLCGLGMLDETEVETIPGAKRVDGEASVVDETPVAKATPLIQPVAQRVAAPVLEAERPAHIDADGVVEEAPPTAAEASTNGWAKVQLRKLTWSAEEQACLPPDEAEYLFADPEAEQNREMYLSRIREIVTKLKLKTPDKQKLRMEFLGSPTADLDSANVYLLRAMWKRCQALEERASA
jgi:hypothetical protein